MQLDSLHTYLDALFEGAYVVDLERRVLFWNAGAERISGYLSREVVGSRCADGLLCHVDDKGEGLCRGECPLSIAMSEGKPREGRVYLHHREGHRVPVAVRCVPLYDASGAVTGALEVFRDVSGEDDLRDRLDELQRQALLDPVTGIGNRRHAEQVLRQRHDEMERYGWGFAVILADLDDFKAVNDTHGHDVGDRVLRMVAETLAHNLRPSDFVGRWGGDEFLAVLPRVNHALLMRATDRLRALVAGSFLTGPAGERLSVTASFGATLARPEDGFLAVVNRADQQLLGSKSSGKNRLSSTE